MKWIAALFLPVTLRVSACFDGGLLGNGLVARLVPDIEA